MITLQDQTNLEKSMADGGIARFNSALNKIMDKGLESTTKHGGVIISQAIDKVAEGLDELQNTSKNNRSTAKSKLRHLDSKLVSKSRILI